jgi:hypothetical protein
MTCRLVDRRSLIIRNWFGWIGFQVVSVSAFMICLLLVSIKNIAIALVSTYAMA